MKKLRIPFLLITSVVFVLLSCNKANSGNEGNDCGNPLIVVDTLTYDAESQTFSLQLHTDSIADAEVKYFLFDGDSLLQESTDGRFNGILPLEEGYNVQAQVVWSDTTIVTPIIHLVNFIVPREPVEKISQKDLQILINAQDHSLRFGDNEHLIQGVDVKMNDGQDVSFQDVFLNLDNKVWLSVQVTDIKYDENNLVTAIVLKPIVALVPNDEDDDDFDWFGEY